MTKKERQPDHPDDERLEMFLDGLMSDAEAAKFLADADNLEEVTRQREIQSKIDDSLRRTFKFDSLNADALTEKITASISTSQSEIASQPSLPVNLPAVKEASWFKAVLAASLLLAMGLGVWMFGGSDLVEPSFRPRALAMIYQETKERGFKPYYNCEDDKRFADTFEARHRQRLRLSEMPEGTQMLGLSYPGGISRNTTAMLGQVDGNPVMVFVDEASNRDQVIASVDQNPNLNVFPVEKNGLIFCEVTPLNSPKMIQYFEFPDSQ